MLSISSCGDFGDLTYLLGVMAEIPHGPHRLILRTSPLTKIKAQDDLKRFHAMVAPLASKQPYIASCEIWDGKETVDWGSEGFRGVGKWCPETTLLGAKSYYLHMCHGFGANIQGRNRWLHNIDPSPESRDRVVINRTGRYRNPHFPWQEIVNFYGDRLLFVGVPHEYRDFCGQYGAVEFHRTSNLLQVASLIAGSLLFIGNQSCANACAEGLKHPLIQETDLVIPDCIFVRPSAQHVGDGRCVLPGFDGDPPLRIGTKIKPIYRTDVIPPNYWEYPSLAPNKILYDQAEKVGRMENIDAKIATARILEHNVALKPHFFVDKSSQSTLYTFNLALQNAQR